MFVSVWVVVYDESDFPISKRVVFSNLIKSLRPVVIFPVFDVFRLKALFLAREPIKRQSKNQKEGGSASFFSLWVKLIIRKNRTIAKIE